MEVTRTRSPQRELWTGQETRPQRMLWGGLPTTTLQRKLWTGQETRPQRAGAMPTLAWACFEAPDHTTCPRKRGQGTLLFGCLLAAIVLTTVGTSSASAQSSSLYGSPEKRQPLTLRDLSWTYQPAEEPRQYQLNDLITVLVDEKAQVVSEGAVDRRQKTDATWSLKDWVVFFPSVFGLRPDPQVNGDPTVSHKMDGKYRAESDLETRESMKFTMACRVVDIRPNGNLVLEGRRVVQNNEESWEMALGGVVRPEDILPNNTVLSETIADLMINKREAGVIRDGYRRGWMMKWLDQHQPF